MGDKDYVISFNQTHPTLFIDLKLIVGKLKLQTKHLGCVWLRGKGKKIEEKNYESHTSYTLL